MRKDECCDSNQGGAEVSISSFSRPQGLKNPCTKTREAAVLLDKKMEVEWEELLAESDHEDAVAGIQVTRMIVLTLRLNHCC